MTDTSADTGAPDRVDAVNTPLGTGTEPPPPTERVNDTLIVELRTDQQPTDSDLFTETTPTTTVTDDVFTRTESTTTGTPTRTTSTTDTPTTTLTDGLTGGSGGRPRPPDDSPDEYELTGDSSGFELTGESCQEFDFEGFNDDLFGVTVDEVAAAHGRS